MIKKVIFVIVIGLSLLIVGILFFLKPHKAIDTEKIKIVLNIDENSIYDDDNIVDATLKVENNNKFDIIICESMCSGEDLYFDDHCDGVYTIKAEDIYEHFVTFEFFDEKINKSEYSHIINGNKLTFEFNIEEANQGESVFVTFDVGKGTISKVNE